jgi:flavin reductase (DIM6/NTAB) family NADH-FMN oxidoreductase RutF
MIYNIKDLEKTKVYKLMSNLVVPRPIAWISTVSKNSIANLAPFSYFTPLSSSPATMLISIGHKPNGDPKDTLKNLRETKKCTIVIATLSQLQDMHNSSTALNYDISEFEEFNIETKLLNPDYPPIPSRSKVAFFCDYLQEVDLKDSKTIPTIVEVKEIFVDDSLIVDKEQIRVSFDKAIARVGASYFAFGNELTIDKL